MIDNRRRAADFIQGSPYNHGQHTKVSIIWSYFDGCICSRDVDPAGTGISDWTGPPDPEADKRFSCNSK